MDANNTDMRERAVGLYLKYKSVAEEFKRINALKDEHIEKLNNKVEELTHKIENETNTCEHRIQALEDEKVDLNEKIQDLTNQLEKENKLRTDLETQIQEGMDSDEINVSKMLEELSSSYHIDTTVKGHTSSSSTNGAPATKKRKTMHEEKNKPVPSGTNKSSKTLFVPDVTKDPFELAKTNSTSRKSLVWIDHFEVLREGTTSFFNSMGTNINNLFILQIPKKDFKTFDELKNIPQGTYGHNDIIFVAVSTHQKYYAYHPQGMSFVRLFCKEQEQGREQIEFVKEIAIQGHPTIKIDVDEKFIETEVERYGVLYKYLRNVLSKKNEVDLDR
ncbi:hypothetical protein AKO1_006816 [Acrasis kona]|uniref:Uncharacterized protein n=1 Tax=Acrasis kona TaxID=1008807 RepID=A0AAW2YUB0_9EUKA